jgi:hypothetical protein
MRTNPYPALAVGGATDRRANKEVVLMRQENGTPANRRPLAALYAILVVLVGFVGLAVIMGTSRAIDWVGTSLLPMVVLLGVVGGVVGLLVWEGERSTRVGTNSTRRTSENPVEAKLAEHPFPALG